MRRTVNGTTYNVTTGHALGDTAQPALEVFDCAEQGGFVWLFFGDHNMPADMRPDIPSVPELQLPGAPRTRAVRTALVWVSQTEVHVTARIARENPKRPPVAFV